MNIQFWIFSAGIVLVLTSGIGMLGLLKDKTSKTIAYIGSTLIGVSFAVNLTSDTISIATGLIAPVAFIFFGVLLLTRANKEHSMILFAVGVTIIATGACFGIVIIPKLLEYLK